MEEKKKPDIVRVEQNDKRPDCTFKVIFAGEKGAGKTALVKRITEGVFREDYRPTIAGDLSFLYYRQGERNIRVALWDTSGEERYQAMTKTYFADADAAFILFDLTNKTSFEKVPFWLSLVQERNVSQAGIYLVGSKRDLEARGVPAQVVAEYIEEEKDKLRLTAEVSAKTGEGVEDLFANAVKQMAEQQEVRSSVSELCRHAERGSFRIKRDGQYAKQKRNGCSC